ncbi:hypothetical protein HHK36_021055 [Tetracentron sinense]|uniref:B box-type domain-containing protein n=1 Tax=Tetracentron sinense TaxID=13715 RepID=A0A835D702_TETSI|nr:hypothetical protein HHK36_021055 [Tetracentron sinense]
MKLRVCELCNGEASLYCVSDSAFLCWNCDARVHGANFLVARHVRRTVCPKCRGFDGNRYSGVRFGPSRSICRSCSPESGVDDLEYSSSSLSLSSACISSTESVSTVPKKKIAYSISVPEVSSFPAKFSGDDSTKRIKNSRGQSKTLSSRVPANVDTKAEGIMVNWCRKLGLKNSCSVPLASHAFGLFLQKLTVLPFRVSLASSLWLSLKLCEGQKASTCQNLKKLEEISGVPAKLIVLAETKLCRILKMRKPQHDQEEGWAECSD